MKESTTPQPATCPQCRSTSPNEHGSYVSPKDGLKHMCWHSWHEGGGEAEAPVVAPAKLETPTKPGLLPCPFCGRQPYRTETVNGTNMLKIGCSSCGVEIKAAKVLYPGRTEWTRNLEAVWNQRVAAPVVTAPPSTDWDADIQEFRVAPGGEGKYAPDWADKPHRVLYDLCALLQKERRERASGAVTAPTNKT